MEEEKIEKNTEEQISPVMHSMHKDTAEISKDVAGSSVTEEEAILITSMKEGSMKRRTRNFLGILSFVLIVISIGMIIAPDLFLNKLKTQEILSQQKDKTQESFLKVDGVYKINLPTESEIDVYRNKKFNTNLGINEIKIFKDNSPVLFSELSPLLNQRFIDGIKTTNIESYFYGIVKEKETSNFFLILTVADQDATEKDLLTLERTMHSDFKNILNLQEDLSIETKEFSTFVSVRSPLRELLNNSNETVIVYGFPIEKKLLITTNKETYNIVKARIIAGF